VPEISLVVESGRPAGSRAARRLRRAGKVPGVLYGHGVPPRPVAVDAKALRSALSTAAGANALLEVELDGGRELAMAKEVQRHPLRPEILHVDLLLVRRDEQVRAEVPVVLTGDAAAVRTEGGSVEQELFSLPVRCVPSAIPEAVEVDVSGLAVGGAIRVGDLVLPASVAAEADPDTVVVVGQPPRVAAEPEQPVEDAGAGGEAGS
jgi:large subunit ribosomal protein L25